MKEFWKSKTFWFNVLAALVAVAGVFGFADYQPSAETGQIIGVIVALVNVALRFLTTEPVTIHKG